MLVDLTMLFPREPHRSGRYHPNGLQLNKVVEGKLTCFAAVSILIVMVCNGVKAL